MAAGKEIRGKIKSVENTKKITKAMEMVAASKMRKAQERMRAARPYSEKIRNIAANLSQANPEYVHPFMQVNQANGAGYIVVTTDKGLCGGLNTNVLRSMHHKMRDLQGQGLQPQAVAIGNKGYMDDIEIKRVLAFESELHSYLKDKHASLLANLEANKAMDKDAEAELTAGLTAFKKTFA